MGTKDYARILRRSWIWMLAVAIIGTLGAWAVTTATTPQYSATSAAFVSSDRAGSLNELTQGNAFTERRVNTYARLATEPIVTLPVIEEFDLGITAEEFAERITVSIPIDTTMVEITVRDVSPKVASSLANAIVTSLTTVVGGIEPAAVPPTAPDGTVLGAATPLVKITQVRFAEVPEQPVSPILWFNLAIGLFIGLALGALAAILREVLDTRVRALDDIEALTAVPIVGAIPQLPKGRSATVVAQAGEPGNTFDEAFRILRTNLQFLDVGGPATFVVTSPSSGDGKSTVAANLAVAIAANGLRVLVIDADLRRPQVHENFGVEGGAGLTDILIGRAELADVVQPWRSQRLHLLAAGRIPPNPSELLGSTRMQDLMDQVADLYDVVLYDCAPILPVPDAAILSRHAGGVLVVASIDRSTRDQVRGALGALSKVSANISGIVANRLAQRGSSSGYRMESYHSHTLEEQGSERAFDELLAPAATPAVTEQGENEQARRDRRAGVSR